MPQPVMPAIINIAEKVPENEKGISLPRTESLKTRTNQIIRFFRTLNPTHWFNDMSDIEISMEEFSSQKNHTPCI